MESQDQHASSVLKEVALQFFLAVVLGLGRVRCRQRLC